jgi:glycosyltransferase involved in cell wall biosynthesis
MMTPTASVIVPAFNAAPYIQRCLDSLLAHDLPLQIIVVNDGSTDDTARRITSVRPPAHHLITVVEQPNAGLSAARNAGLLHARGAYIGFVDADDWVDPDMYATLVDTALQSQAQIVIGNGDMVDHLSGHTRPFHDHGRLSALAAVQTGVFNPRHVPEVFALDTSVCRRLYDRAFLERLGFRFAEGLLFEDVLAHFQLMLVATRIRVVDRSCYRYRINHPGRITDRSDARILTIFEILVRSQRVLTEEDASLDIWATFIWFQSWVLRWLGSQIATVHRADFVYGIHALVERLPSAALVRFLQQFAHDRQALEFVALERFRMDGMLWRFLANDLTSDDRRLLEDALDRGIVHVESDRGLMS